MSLSEDVLCSAPAVSGDMVKDEQESATDHLCKLATVICPKLVESQAESDDLRARRGTGTPSENVVWHDRVIDSPPVFEEMTLPMIFDTKCLGLEDQSVPEDAGRVDPSIPFAKPHYYRQNLIGGGAYSDVYSVLDSRGGTKVAMKIHHRTQDAFHAGYSEIRVLKKIQAREGEGRQHLVEMLEYFYFREHLVIVTELMLGSLYEFNENLKAKRLQSDYFTARTIGELSRQILAALAFLHADGIVHADVKPENIGVASASLRTFKLLDFDKALFENDPVCSYMTSRYYRAPEIALGLPSDHRVDTWSLGCVLGYLLLGTHLFAAESVAALLASHAAVCGQIPKAMIVATPQISSMFFTPVGDEIYDVGPSNSPGGVYILEPAEGAALRTLLAGVSHAEAGLVDLVSTLLTIDNTKRPSAEAALDHEWLLDQRMMTPSTNDAVIYDFYARLQAMLAEDPLLSRWA